MKIFALLSIAFFCVFASNAQIFNPNCGTKSHPTLSLNKIENKNGVTVFQLSIRNELSKGGWFCASQNIGISNSIGTQTYMKLKSENIPTCPQSYHFTFTGEVLNFSLYFPNFDKSIKYLDLVEQCNDACFYIKGIILLPEFNIETEKAFALYASKQYEKSAQAFVQIIQKYPDYPYGIYYFNAIKTYSELKNKAQAKFWFEKLNAAAILDKQFYSDIITKDKYLSN